MIAQEILPNIYTFENQKLFGSKVNVYLLNKSNNVILFDIPSYSEELQEYVKSFNKKIICIVSDPSNGALDGLTWKDNLDVNFYVRLHEINTGWSDLKPNVISDEEFELEGLKIIHTPGSSYNSICTYDHESKSLFSGDSIVYRDNSFEIGTHIEPLSKLKDLDFENLLPYHGEYLIKTGKDQLMDELMSNPQYLLAF